MQYEYQNGYLVRLRDFHTPSEVFWEAFATAPSGQFVDEQQGREIRTLREYDLATGWLRSIQTGLGGTVNEQNLAFTWDKVGNFRTRADLNQGTLIEEFFYDDLNRLDYVQRNGTITQDLAYDFLSNITTKSDVGGYTYHATKKHAVIAAGSNTYAYDANGNMTSRNGHTTSWYSYNLPQTINGPGGKSATFFYGADRQRYKQLHQAWADGSSPRTTIYAGSLYERAIETDAGFEQVIHRHYLFASGRRVGTHLRFTEPGTDYRWTTYYTHDHLGSIVGDYPNDEDSSYSFSYDAFGKRRGTSWTGAPSPEELGYAWADRSNRGFTDHEHLDNLGGLIHMNGRAYDAVIGRFISADPFIDGWDHTQGFNRYSYVKNNPLSRGDPTGFRETVWHQASTSLAEGQGNNLGTIEISDRMLSLLDPLRAPYMGSSGYGHVERRSDATEVLHEVTARARRGTPGQGPRQVAPVAIASPQEQQSSQEPLDEIVVTASTPPPPSSLGGPWKWYPDPGNTRGGTWRDPTGRSASWDRPGNHWDVDDGKGNRQRYNRWGAPLSVEEAHRYRGAPQAPLLFPRAFPFFWINVCTSNPYFLVCSSQGPPGV